MLRFEISRRPVKKIASARPAVSTFCLSGCRHRHKVPASKTMMMRSLMLNYLGIATGGALGTLARFWISGFVAARFGEAFPFNTLIVNISGSFVIGFFAALTSPDGVFLVRPEIR